MTISKIKFYNLLIRLSITFCIIFFTHGCVLAGAITKLSSDSQYKSKIDNLKQRDKKVIDWLNSPSSGLKHPENKNISAKRMDLRNKIDKVEKTTQLPGIWDYTMGQVEPWTEAMSSLSIIEQEYIKLDEFVDPNAYAKYKKQSRYYEWRRKSVEECRDYCKNNISSLTEDECKERCYKKKGL
ncbi:MAG: hypothetical protein AAF518_19700 [Spirochaetota bacterium]